jgi:hypothetical protein
LIKKTSVGSHEFPDYKKLKFNKFNFYWVHGFIRELSLLRLGKHSWLRLLIIRALHNPIFPHISLTLPAVATSITFMAGILKLPLGLSRVEANTNIFN